MQVLTRNRDNVPKGYTFVGLTQNLETKLSAIKSIPATYDWTRTNTTAYKGNICFDFMTSDTKGDSTSSKAQELMLWLNYTGGQLPLAGPRVRKLPLRASTVLAGSSIRV